MKKTVAITLFILSLFPVAKAGYPDGAEVKHQHDIFYSEKNDSLQSLDVYWNPAASGADVILFVHGGGWLTGDKKSYRDMASSLAAGGKTIVLVNYRLSPKVKFPAHAEDVAAAIHWVHDSIHRYNGSNKSIYLAGHSSGAHLITLLMCDEQYLEKYAMKQSDIAGVITLSGVFDIKTQEGGATKTFLGMVFGDDEQVWKKASCKTYIDNHSKNKLPPFLITWVEQEGALIVQESRELIELFKSAGISYQSFVFKGKDHNAFIKEWSNRQSGFSKKVETFIQNK